jgi:uncharacterized RDD family membrane protein YckC
MGSPDKLTIDTPEQTALEFPLAGIGSRFLGMAADTAIQIVLGLVLFIGAGLLLPSFSFISKATPQWIIAGMIFAIFLLNSAYYAFFESIWNGQTPGKRYAQLRVMKDDGRPISAYDAIVRNLMRIVDQLPALYGVGVICVLFSKESKRLGDYVAGTVVVHEKTLEGVRPIGEAHADATLPTFDASSITLDELRLIETFIHRRDSWEPGVRTTMATQIATRIGDKLGVKVYGWPRTENFLEAVLQQCRNAGRYRSS